MPCMRQRISKVRKLCVANPSRMKTGGLVVEGGGGRRKKKDRSSLSAPLGARWAFDREIEFGVELAAVGCEFEGHVIDVCV